MPKALPQPPSAKALGGDILPKPQPLKRRGPSAVPSGKPHQFESPTRRGQPAWLNADNGRQTCTVCGVEVYPPGAYVMADHAGMGQDPVLADAAAQKRMTNFTYVDAKGNVIHSPVALGCPVFMLDHKGETMANKERHRQLDDRVDGVDDRLDEIAGSLEERLYALEAENSGLRARVDAAQADVNAVVDWLSQMVALHTANNLETVKVHIEGRPVAALPPPVADLILNLGQVHEKVPVILDAEFSEEIS